MKKILFLVGFLVVTPWNSIFIHGAETPVSVGTFMQETARAYTSSDGLPDGEIHSMAAAKNGAVYAGTEKGVYVFGDQTWKIIEDAPQAPVYIIKPHKEGIVAAIEESLYEILPDSCQKISFLPTSEVNDISTHRNTLFAATNYGLYRIHKGRVKPVRQINERLGKNPKIHAVACSQEGVLAAAADAGLFVKKPSESWTAVYPRDEDHGGWTPQPVLGVEFDNQGRLWFASRQGVGCYGSEWTLYTGRDGLPYNDFTCLRTGEDGAVWFGTQIGAIRFDGENWGYRQGRRWLPHDQINDISIMPDGSAWIATPGGVGFIERRPMTLQEKALFYEEEIERYIKRTEFGYLSEVVLPTPGDKSEIRYSDSDNDGLWTSMYGAGECFAYGATKNPQAKERARQAFEALRFLSAAPVGGEVEQQSGFVARTVVPTTEPDPNKREAYTLEGMKRRRESNDARWKVYYPRWPLTKDGKYWYKTDASSDELDGHFFFYPLYYDLAADTPEEKERVRKVVKNIIDHLIRNDFCLVDHDGTPTRWAVFSPKSLNHDFAWYAERGLNSLSMLSYLAAAEHITGDARYGEISQNLIDEHSYHLNAMVSKMQRGIGSGNQSDDEMAFMSYYNLIKYTKNETLRKQILFSFYNYWTLEFPEMNPFFNFAYAACGLGEVFSDPWGTYDLSPWEGWLKDSIDALTGFPLDRVNWAHRNSHRIDIIPLARHAGTDPDDERNRARGYRTDGKVLPVQERHFNHWNTDPWTLNSGGDGRVLANGTVYLLPYYMGLYHGYIK